MLVASLITGALALFAFGFILARVTPREERWQVAFCVVATLPMCWVMFHLVRLPLDGSLKASLGEGELLRWIWTAYASITEEPAKLWPLLLPWIRLAVTPRSAARYALALGTGFALGEVFTVAGLIAQRQPQRAALPWYQLNPFIVERLMTFVIHSGMTAIVLAAWRRGPGFLPGLALAILAHWLVNIPITLSQAGWFGSNKLVTDIIVGLWITACFVLFLFWLGLLDIGRVGLGSMFHGRATCPECGLEFDRRLLLGLNIDGDRRYEPCPRCQRWHWTKRNRETVKTIA
jgi:hypothetical protein